jgi:hypothetical protein
MGQPLGRAHRVLDLIHAIATIRGDTRYVQPILQAALDGLSAQTR